MINHYAQPDGLGPGNGYSHVTVATGRVVAVSGQLPVTTAGTVVPGGTLAQARQVFANLTAALHAAGATAGDVLRLNFYVLDLADLTAVRTARDEFLADGPPPASTLVQVVGLVLPDARLEIDALAILP